MRHVIEGRLPTIAHATDTLFTSDILPKLESHLMADPSHFRSQVPRAASI